MRINTPGGYYAIDEVKDGPVLNLAGKPSIWAGLVGLAVRKSVRI